MQVSFQRLLENMRQQHQHSSSKAVDAVRTGLNIRDDFWDDFLLVINNSDALSELLDVPSAKISTWHSKVRSLLDKVKQMDTVPDGSKKGKVIPTGGDDPMFGGGNAPEPPGSI